MSGEESHCKTESINLHLVISTIQEVTPPSNVNKQLCKKLTCPMTLSLMYSPSFLSPKSSAEGFASCKKNKT